MDALKTLGGKFNEGRFKLNLRQYTNQKKLIEQLSVQLSQIDASIAQLNSLYKGNKIDDTEYEIRKMSLHAQREDVRRQIDSSEFTKQRLKSKLDDLMRKNGEQPLPDYDNSSRVMNKVKDLAKSLIQKEIITAITSALVPLAPFILVIVLVLCTALFFMSTLRGATSGFDFSANCPNGEVNESCKRLQDENSAERVYNTESCGSYGNPCETN